MQNLTVGLLKRIAAAIAAQFGSNCEVVIYDLTCENPEAQRQCRPQPCSS